ncbi:unnamed protein product [Blepharisma stoltei]|uniref:F-box domain-containing protein n=1 Tax=Blepharisma stoltei TaxID=1481888 RepID=A0AAU9IXI9_9CILI|nr:unnamed protein product [Blepharisma stoltei]
MDVIPEELLILVFSYLDLTSLSFCEQVCKYWNLILSSESQNCLFQVIDVFSTHNSIAPPFEWTLRKAVNHKTKELIIGGSNYKRTEVILLIDSCANSLISLDLSFFHLKQSFYQTISNKNSIILEKLTICDARLRDECLEWILKIGTLKYLNVNNNTSLVGKPFLTCQKPLEALWFEGCENLEYENILPYVTAYGDRMDEFGIDGENYSSYQVCTLLSNVLLIKKFSIGFANEMQDEMLYYLIKTTWEYLKIKKGINLTENGFSEIFSQRLNNLEYLELAECSAISDKVCILIGENCPNLHTLIITWSDFITDLGIISIINGCESLRNFDLTGQKCITENAFPIDKPYKIYFSLLTLYLSQCNKVNDSRLWELSNQYPQIKIKNYYGEFKEGW